jgi:lambda family phage tail tape measure protein
LQEQKNKFLQENATATDIERQNAEALFNLEQERLKTLKAIQQIKDLPEGERAAREKEINEEFARRKQLTVSQQAADRSLSQNFEAGWEKAYRQYSEDSRNAFNIAGKIFNNVTQGMEDAISNFAKTGKFEFKGFVSSMLDELLRSQVRQLMASLFSFSSGNNFASSIGNLLGFASGGVIPTNNPVLVGERGPEILSGVAGRVVTPNNQIGGGAMVTYNINAVDSASFKAMIAKDPSFIHAVASQGARTIPNRR